MKREITIQIADTDSAGYRFLLGNGYLRLEDISDTALAYLFINYPNTEEFINVSKMDSERIIQIIDSVLRGVETNKRRLTLSVCNLMMRLYEGVDSSTKSKISQLAYIHKDVIPWTTATDTLKWLDVQKKREVITNRLLQYYPRDRLSVAMKLYRFNIIGPESETNITIEEIENLFTDEELITTIYKDRHFVDVEPIVFPTGKLSEWFWSIKIASV